ncbi:hypothetical protein WP50_09800 [Lactiplantibacillus plantarum]|nr:hypothetical protein WP50_09800 [Lactiplantibacillus plantarum]
MRMLEKIEQYIDSCIEAGDIYGASFSLITPKGINQYYHGKQGRDEFAVGLDPAMIYDLASVTKVVGTTTRIFQLLSDHTIHLTDRYHKEDKQKLVNVVKGGRNADARKN